MSGYGYKRKRGYSHSANVLALYRPKAQPLKRTKRMFVPGKSRIGGFYGRFPPNGGELKFHDVTVDDAVVAAGGVITDSINKIAQGVTESQRVGRKCTIKSINWRYRVSLPEVDALATPSQGDTIRVILYIDKQCNGATIANTDLMETANWQTFRNLSNSGRFTILCDKQHVMNYATLASDGAGVVSSAEVARDFTFYKKCDLPIEFNATTGAITEIRSNNLGVMLLTANGTCSFFSQFRLRFSDN